MPYDAEQTWHFRKVGSDTLLQREQRMTANAARAVKQQENWSMQSPFWEAVTQKMIP